MRTPRSLLLAALAGAALLIPATAAPAATNPWLAKRVMNIAHQGGEDEFPSNTLYAFRKSLKAGADMLELDVGVTKDGQVIVMHDTSVDRVTNGTGLVSEKTLKQIRKLDGAYWFSAGDDAYRHDRSPKAYRFRGVATGGRKAPKGYRASDFRVTTLREVLKAFPKTPINIEIKGRTKQEAVAEYVKNAEVPAGVLKGAKRRSRLIVVSFKQEAVDRFHELVPSIGVAPGVGGSASFLLANGSPGPGVVAFQLPITYDLSGTHYDVTTGPNVKKAHDAGYAWHTWLSDDGESPATWRTLIDECVDGVMTARPVAFEKVLRAHPAPAACG